MSNIYNLQQISLNSRIVAVEGTFDHIDANNINYSGDVNVDGKLLVDQIDEKTLGAGITFDKEIYVDRINEKTLNNGVEFPQKIRVNEIDQLDNGFIQINEQMRFNTGTLLNMNNNEILNTSNIATAEISSLGGDIAINSNLNLNGNALFDISSLSTGFINANATNVQFNNDLNMNNNNITNTSDIDTDTISKSTANNSVRIQKPRALTLIDEYARFDITFTNIDNTAFKQPTSLTVLNSGDNTFYLPVLTGVRLQCNTSGIYCIQVNLRNDTVLSSTQDTYDLVLEGSSFDLTVAQQESGSQTAIGDYRISATFVGLLVPAQFIEFKMKLTQGVAINKDFSGTVTVSRIC